MPVGGNTKEGKPLTSPICEESTPRTDRAAAFLLTVMTLTISFLDTTHPYHPKTNLPHKRSKCQLIVCGAKRLGCTP